ncbi:MAG: S1C family serine protease [Verrucomicrobiae bacterium]|nr:S1C family serine protease [Verrucomicrobiae bacterium]
MQIKFSNNKLSGAIFLVLFSVALLVLFGAGCATYRPIAKYQNYQQCVVEVLVDGSLQGSGWYAGPAGEVITAAHVVKQGNKIEIINYERKRIPYNLLAVDIGNDVALLMPAEGCRIKNYFAIQDKPPQPFEMIYFAGAALFRHNLILPGWVARLETTYEYSPIFDECVAVYHVAADTPPGTSGGCWINRSGKVVGLQSGLMTLGGAGQGIAFVVPASALQKILRERKSQSTSSIQCVVEELWEQSVDVIKKFPDEARGVYVAKLMKNGVAEKAGLKKGDLIISINERSVQRRDEFVGILRKTSKGDILKLSVISQGDNKPKTLEVKVQCLEDIFKLTE